MATTQEIKDKLTKKKAQLLLAETTYEELLADTVESYKFDSGDGSQSTKKRGLQELKDQIDSLEAEINSLERKLSGKGLTNISLNRYGRCRR